MHTRRIGSTSAVRVANYVRTVRTGHPAVINGCCDLLVQVFGERGRHARSAVGLTSLSMGTVVEIEMIVDVD